MINIVQILDTGVCAGAFGDAGIPARIANVISMIYTAIQILIPVALVIWGMLDLGKAVMAQKEDEIKKGQQTFIKRIVAAAIVFFVFTIVSLMVSLVSDGDDDTVSNCLNELINGPTN